jgi:enoyl-CoA hydratase
MTWNNLTLEKKDGVAVLRINRPHALNALNSDVFTDLYDCIPRIAYDPEVDVLIVSGEGDRAFVAGADIAEMQAFTAEQAQKFAERGHKAFTMIEHLPQPVIGAINGFCLGGGNELAMACDFRIASEGAKFGQPEVGLGIPPGFGGTQRLHRLIGPARARYLLMTAELIDAGQALAWGLVDIVVPAGELMDKTLETAAKIRKNSRFAVGQTKQCTLKGMEAGLDAGQELEAMAFGVCFSTEDQKKRMQRFLDKSKK